MTQLLTQTPKKRINSIDALRGFALIGIMMFHCMEQFDIMSHVVPASPTWQLIDDIVFTTISFLVAGKSYAIFSLLFGLSFFMQMDSQADKGVDFRLRFLWRLMLLLVLGYLNGLVYMGEFFTVYAILGITLIPLYKVPSKWLIGIAILLFLQLPDIITLVSLLIGNIPNEPSAAVVYQDSLYAMCGKIYKEGSLLDVLEFNVWKGLAAKLLWTFTNSRYLQLIGLFILGMLIGRSGIHKSEEKMVYYSRKVLPYSIALFAIFYALVLLLPSMGLEKLVLEKGITIFKLYSNLGMMFMYITGFTILFYTTKAGNKVLNTIAPMGRMSVTNYMTQSIVGVSLFYGFGGNFAASFSILQCAAVGLVVCTIQVIFSNWWMNRYYYGPVEWIWRVATWFKKIPLRRN